MATGYADLSPLDEGKRIETIGDAVMRLKKKVGFVVDDDGEKADRYIKKLKEKYPGIVVHRNSSGPVKGTRTVTVGPPA